MLDRDWLHHVAVRGCLIAVAVSALCIGIARAEDNSPSKAGGSTQQPQGYQAAPQSRIPVPITVVGPVIVREEKPEAGEYRPDCAKPKDHDEADLCVQREMADAAYRSVDVAKDSVWYASTQSWIGGLGLAFLVATLIANICATRAATKAANAATRQVEIMRDADRPYVFLDITAPGVAVGERGEMSVADQRMVIQFVNYGRGVALMREFNESYPIIEGRTDVPPAIDPMQVRGRLLPEGTVSAPGKPYELGTRLFTEIDVGRLTTQDAWKTCRLFFHGFVRYSDTFGRHYITGFLAHFHPGAKKWGLRGGPAYNFTRIEDPKNIPPHPDYPAEDAEI